MYAIEANSLLDLLQKFPNEESCIKHLELIYGKNGKLSSPFSPTSKVYKLRNNQYKCKTTGKIFNVKTGTIFENTKISLPKWFMAVWLITSHKKGISSYQLARDIGVTQKTAWFMLHRVRKGLESVNGIELTGVIEIDETFVGGKNKNRHINKKVKNSQGRSFKDKTPVLGLLERNGLLVAKVIKSTESIHLTSIINQYVSKDAILYTDEWQGYNTVRRLYKHDFIDHSTKQYCKGEVCTNKIEGFWGLFKRGVIGIYHKISKKHLHYYVDEFVFRYNVRDWQEVERFNLAIECLAENRLKYKDLICKSA
ncbi:MAG: IS1595 family transposase [Oscillibacter sp.]|nr:IS1595 family transposase [Oscillibacter sp.]